MCRLRDAIHLTALHELADMTYLYLFMFFSSTQQVSIAWCFCTLGFCHLCSVCLFLSAFIRNMNILLIEIYEYRVLLLKVFTVAMHLKWKRTISKMAAGYLRQVASTAYCF